MSLGSWGSRDVTPSQTCLHTQGNCPCLVLLSLNTPAGICSASLCHGAWIILDLPSNVVRGSRRAKNPSTGTEQLLCAPAAHQPRVGASTKTSPRSAAASLSPPRGTSALPLLLCALMMAIPCCNSLLQGLMAACSSPQRALHLGWGEEEEDLAAGSRGISRDLLALKERGAKFYLSEQESCGQGTSPRMLPCPSQLDAAPKAG